MPAEESRTHMPVRHAPTDASFTAVSSTECTLAHKNYFGGRAALILQRGGNVFVCFGLPARDGQDHVAHLQARRLGRVLIAAVCVNVAEADNHRAVGKHLDAERRAAHLNRAPLHHLRTDGLDGHEARDGQLRVIGRAVLHTGDGVRRQGGRRAHKGHPGDGDLAAGGHQKGVGQERANVQGKDKKQHHTPRREKTAPFNQLFHVFSPFFHAFPAEDRVFPFYVKKAVFVRRAILNDK